MDPFSLAAHFRLILLLCLPNSLAPASTHRHHSQLVQLNGRTILHSHDLLVVVLVLMLFGWLFSLLLFIWHPIRDEKLLKLQMVDNIICIGPICCFAFSLFFSVADVVTCIWTLRSLVASTKSQRPRAKIAAKIAATASTKFAVISVGGIRIFKDRNGLEKLGIFCNCNNDIKQDICGGCKSKNNDWIKLKIGFS
jgi:hypothetical protein